MRKDKLCFSSHRAPKSKTLIGFVVGLVLSALFVAFATADSTVFHITDKTNPKIVELYNQLQEKREQVSKIESERRDALDKNFQAMHDKEQSIENRTLTSATTVATGEGAMTAASAYAEQSADADAERDMAAYLATFKCGYGDGKTVKYGADDIALPGGNELLEYYNEYKQLAESVKTTKTALGLKPGIESEISYDRAQSGLYQYTNATQQSGGELSLSRALTDTTSADATKLDAQKSETADKLKTGATAAGVGAIGGVVGNTAINTDVLENIIDKLKE